MGGGASKIDPSKDPAFAPKHNKPFYIEMELECEDFDVVFDSNAAEPGGKPLAAAAAGLCASGRLSVDGIETNLQKGLTRTLTFELRGDLAPYACENFRRLALEPAGPGKPAPYVGTYVHDVMPGISVSGGRVGKHAEGDALLKNKSVSAFGGKPFGDEHDGESELEHERGSLCLTTTQKAQGKYGSEPVATRPPTFFLLFFFFVCVCV